MKKLLIAAAFICSITSYAQNKGGAVMFSPDNAQGYLVLNKAKNPSVTTWSIKVKERTFNAQGTPTDVQRDKVALQNNINFWRVPNKYLNSESTFFLEVTGLTSGGSTVVTEEPFVVSDAPSTALESGGTEPSLLGCNWLCNGSYYAWEIQQYVSPDLPTAGPSRLEVRTALNFNTGTQTALPNYRYITQNEFSNSSCFDQNGNNLGGYFIPGVPCNPDGVWMTGSISVPLGSTDYRDMDGNVIPGPSFVRGVGKPLGVWDGGNSITTPELNFGNTVCGNDTWWAMDKVNSNAPPVNGYPKDGTGTNFYPDLECNQLTEGGVDDPDIDHRIRRT
ncbi:MAG: hypothetical protein K9G46_08505 [Flavobacteriales bacterium]|nr:hypothetical protein [Flavobacteriales bacterium]